MGNDDWIAPTQFHLNMFETVGGHCCATATIAAMQMALALIRCSFKVWQKNAITWDCHL
jgi:hypothetical protein